MQFWEVFLKVHEWTSDYSSVQNLLDHLRLYKSGSEKSREEYCNVLARFCRDMNMDPDNLVSLPREKLEELVQEHINKIKLAIDSRGPSTRYVNVILFCLKAFFRVNGFNRDNGTELRLKEYYQAPRVRNRPEYVPELKEANLMAERAGNKRNRAIISTLLSSGLRNSALRAIKVKDIWEELSAGHENLVIRVEPEWNGRIPGACKNKIPYYTFTSRTATEAIKDMLEERRWRFGELNGEEPLFISEHNKIQKRDRRFKPLSATEIRQIVKKTAQQAIPKQWKNVTVHTFRKVFESVLRSPLVDGDRLDHKDQEFLMGHKLKGSEDAYYDRTKVKRMRELFSKLIFDDRISSKVEGLNVIRKLARLHGIDPNEVRRRREAALGRSLTLQEEEEILESEIKMQLSRSTEIKEEQKVIPEEELEKYLTEGWVFVSAFNQKIIVKRMPEPLFNDYGSSEVNGRQSKSIPPSKSDSGNMEEKDKRLVQPPAIPLEKQPNIQNMISFGDRIQTSLTRYLEIHGSFKHGVSPKTESNEKSQTCAQVPTTMLLNVEDGKTTDSDSSTKTLSVTNSGIAPKQKMQLDSQKIRTNKRHSCKILTPKSKSKSDLLSFLN